MMHRPLCAAALAVFAAETAAQAPFPGQTPGVDVGGGLPTNFEASGLVWHRKLGQLFVASDQGHVARMEASGAYIKEWNVAGDLEAITVADENSPFVYLGRESPPAVMEFNYVTGAVTRIFNLATWITGSANQLIEGLAFIPDASNPEGGLFFVGHQGEGKIYKFSLPVKSSSVSTAVTFIGAVTPVPGRTDLSDLGYDFDTGILYALYDTDNIITQLSTSGTFVAEWTLPGTNQEGVARRGCDLFIAQDGSAQQVVKYTHFPNSAACAPLAVDTTQLSISLLGTATFQLHAPQPTFAGQLYFLLGSADGTDPGIPMPPFTLPLNPDWYFDTTSGSPNTATFVHTAELFPAGAAASAQLVLPAGVPPVFAGTTLWHAYLIFNTVTGQFTYTSPAVALKLTL